MERITNRRAGILLGLVCALLLGFCVRLYAMQVVDAAEKSNNTTVYIMRTRVRAARGEILDTNGNPLVSNRASYDLVFNHYVIWNSETPNESLRQLVLLCKELGIDYVDHFPMTTEKPFTYTLNQYNSSWQGYFQKYLPTRGNLDSDITAPLLLKTLRDSYEIPEDWSDEEARLVIGLRYELSLRTDITNLPNYVFIEDVSEEALAAILELNTPGLNVEESTVREYHTKYAAHVLGYVGAMSKDQWAYYSKLDYELDAMVGQSGFEEAFEEYLHGTDGVRVDKVTKDGTVVESYYEEEPKSGNNVEVSLDLVLQMAAEDALKKVIEDLRNPEINTSQTGDGLDAEGGAVVALDVKTGQVLVCASYPTYDLANLFSDWENINNTKYGPLLNRALQATYPPGSTYKMNMVLAGVEKNIINIDTTIWDKGVYAVGEFTASCLAWSSGHYTHGEIDCTVALQKSCNYFFYELGMRMKIEDIDYYAKNLGLGELTGVELAERPGSRANPESKADAFAGTDSDGWYAADQLMASIGQSLNQFTPMQMAVYTSALCNQGTRYRATFLNRVVSSDYTSLVYENSAQIANTLAISDRAFEAYTTGMKLVTTINGTAGRVFHNYPIKVAGKTGTAEIGGGSDNGAFVCYAPADDPQIAVVVYGERAGHGTSVVSVAKAVLDVYFDIGDSADVDSFENQIS